MQKQQTRFWNIHINRWSYFETPFNDQLAIF